MVVGLVFVHVAQTVAQHIDQRVPPLQGLHGGQQQHVERVAVQNVPLFVQDDGAAVHAVVGLADDDAPHPAERCHVFGMAVDGAAVLPQSPQASAADGSPYAGHLHQAHGARGRHAGQTGPTQDDGPRQPGSCGGGHVGIGLRCWLHRGFRPLGRGGSRGRGRLYVQVGGVPFHGGHGHMAQRNRQCQQQNAQQHRTIEPEEPLVPEQQQVGNEQQGQHGGRAERVGEQVIHKPGFRCKGLP